MRLETVSLCFACANAGNGMAAEIEAQRPLQHPCCSATMGVDVQQIENVKAASANTPPMAVNRIHMRLFTGTT